MEVEDEEEAAQHVRQLESEEPLLQENPRHFVMFPIGQVDYPFLSFIVVTIYVQPWILEVSSAHINLPYGQPYLTEEYLVMEICSLL